MLPEPLAKIVLKQESTLYILKRIRFTMSGINPAAGKFKSMANRLRLDVQQAMVLVVCLLALSVVHAQSDSFRRLLQSSIQAEERGDWKQAVELSHQILKIKPQDIETMVSLSGLYGHTGNPTQQIFWSQKVLAIQPKNFIALINRGNGYSAIGEDRRAMDSFHAAGTIDPSSPIPAYSMGVLAQNREHDNEAIGYFRRALQLSPKFEDAQFNLAVSLANLGKTAQALDVLDQLLGQNPSASDAIQLRLTLQNQTKR